MRPFTRSLPASQPPISIPGCAANLRPPRQNARQSQARNGEIVVALFEDEATVKTLSQKNGQTWLLPANPDYQPIDGTHAQIIGKVVALLRRY